jgi:poly-gamma-glutamate synthesis protein (capsule biosynthesis protein)
MYKFILLTVLFVGLIKLSNAQQDTLVNTLDSIQNVSGSCSDKMSLLFIGDIMGHGPQILSAYDSETETYNYDTVFYYIKNVLSEPDFTIANLEVTLAGPPYKGYPQFSSPDALALAGKKAGTDVFVTANNHCCDRGLQGINRTIEVLDTLKILHCGTFKNLAERQSNNLIVLEKNQIKVGLLNYTYGTNGIPVPKPAVVNLIDRKLIKEDIEIAQKDSLDKLIVFLHFGTEYQSEPNTEQINLVNYLFNQGVDIVIGSHPHVIQKMVYLPADSVNKERFVAYSLGNFVSNQRKTQTDGGVMTRIVLKKENGKTRIEEHNYILTWVYKKKRTGDVYDYFILPAAEYEDKKDFFSDSVDYEKMKLYIENSGQLLNKQNVDVKELK